MPKKIPKKIARDLAKLGEEVIKEGARQPIEMAKIAGRQIGMLPGWGEESESQLSTRLIQEKKEEEERDLAFARKRIKEMTPAPSQPEPKGVPEKVKRQRELAKEAEKKKGVPKVPGRKPRGSALLRLRQKGRGTREVKAGI